MMTSKVKAISHKRDLIEAVRKVAPASVQLSPTLFRDISANLKTVSLQNPSPLCYHFRSIYLIDCHR
jgi:hypothetical protein